MSTTDKYVTSASSVTGHVYNSLNTSPKTSLSDHIPRVTTKYSSTKSQFIPTMAPVKEIVTTPTPPATFSQHTTNSYIHFAASPTVVSSTRASSGTVASNLQNENAVYQSTTLAPTEAIKIQTPTESLASLLRREGLFAMAKYLRQSGLDNVLNETGELTASALKRLA